MNNATSGLHKISVALATYRGMPYLKEQLESLAQQTRLPDELVVVDDCSDDDTWDELLAFSERAVFPVVLHQNAKNIGYIETFEIALRNCSGDLVFLCDQDDFWLPEKIQSMLHVFEENPGILLAAHDIEYCDEALVPIGQTKFQRMQEVFDLRSSYVVGMATAIRGDFLKTCLPFINSHAFTHDKWLHECAKIVDAKLLMYKVLALHRRHKRNATASGVLNVPHVTSSTHFAPRRTSVWDRLKHDVDSARSAMDNSSALIEWLARARESLTRSCGVRGELIALRIQALRLVFQTSSLRLEVMTSPLPKATCAMIELLRMNGYDQYNGLRTFCGDLFFRMILRR